MFIVFVLELPRDFNVDPSLGSYSLLKVVFSKNIHSPPYFHSRNCALILAHHGYQLRVPQQISVHCLPRERQSSLGPRCKPTDTSWEEACFEGLCLISSCFFAGVKCPGDENARYSGISSCSAHLQLQFRNTLNIISVISDSYPCWGSVAQYSLPGKELSCELVAPISKKRTADLLSGLFSFYTLSMVPFIWKQKALCVN